MRPDYGAVTDEALFESGESYVLSWEDRYAVLNRC